jgi:hypothetical protein
LSNGRITVVISAPLLSQDIFNTTSFDNSMPGQANPASLSLSARPFIRQLIKIRKSQFYSLTASFIDSPVTLFWHLALVAGVPNNESLEADTHAAASPYPWHGSSSGVTMKRRESLYLTRAAKTLSKPDA